MKIVVTGAAGAIGSHLCERLLDLGHEVVGIDALTDYYSPAIKKINAADVEQAGGRMYFMDLVKDDVSHLLTGTDFIFHLAAQPGLSKDVGFHAYLENNVLATHNILAAAKEIKNLKGFIHASTSSVYGKVASGDEGVLPEPISHYGVTKLAAEQLALSYYRESGLPVSVLRFFSVYGERERPEKLYHKLIKAILEGRQFPLYEGAKAHMRSYSYIGDIIDGCILVLENFNKAVGEIFNLGNDRSMSTGDGIEIIESLLGKNTDFLILPPRIGDQKETAANINKMKITFGYKPKVPLAKGLENQVKWYKDKIHNKVK